MANLNISIPDSILFTLRESNAEFSNTMKKYTALKLYEAQKLSLGQASELAGMSKQDFIEYLAENEVSIFAHMSMDDIKRDVENA